MGRALLVLTAVALGPSIAPDASAQAEDRAAARVLFDEGRKLMSSGQHEAACPKFEAAAKLYSSAGILLNLGDCYETTGRSASAWTEFGEAASVAARTNRTGDAAEATRRQSAIEPVLRRLTVRVPHDVEGLVVTRDGLTLARAAWGTPIPIDPGSHEIHAEAPGYDAWSTGVESPSPGQTATIDVPALRAHVGASASAAPVPAPVVTTQEREMPAPMPEHAERGSTALPWALVLVGTAIGVGGGALMYIESMRADDSRNSLTLSSSDKSAEYESTKTPYAVGVGGVIAGGTSVATGLIVFLVSKPSTNATTGLHLVPWLDAHNRGVGVIGAF